MRPYSVTEINKYINKTLSTDFILSEVKIEGEISNFTHHYSGHMYFNLKDDSSKIKSVMFKSSNMKLDFKPEEGMKVIAYGNISVYEKEGIYQLYVRDMEESGIGQLYKEFELLKKKLEKEGLFNQEKKKEIPDSVNNIGVVTSATGAAIRDIITVIKRRFPPANITLYPSLVQGDGAADNIIQGLNYLDSRDDIDLIIFGRGGGSIEELFAFNDENLVRTIYNLETPNIAAIGHETDFTLSDFVADLRAATPSAAAELAVVNIDSYHKKLDDYILKSKNIIESKLSFLSQEAEALNKQISFYNPLKQLEDKKIDIDKIYKDISNYFKNNLFKEKNNLLELKNQLSLLNPQLAMEKGLGIITDKEDRVLRSITEISEGDQIKILLADGRIGAVVESVEEEV